MRLKTIIKSSIILIIFLFTLSSCSAATTIAFTSGTDDATRGESVPSSKESDVTISENAPLSKEHHVTISEDFSSAGESNTTVCPNTPSGDAPSKEEPSEDIPSEAPQARSTLQRMSRRSFRLQCFSIRLDN